MMDLGRLRRLVREHGSKLPWWVSESLEELADRIDELERLIVSIHEADQEMYETLKWYGDPANWTDSGSPLDRGAKARQIIER